MDIEREGTPPTVSKIEAADVWIEILAPVEQARATIGKALHDLTSVPTGISVGGSERGTILLNARAWATFHAQLKALENLQIRHPHDPAMTRALKFYVLT